MRKVSGGLVVALVLGVGLGLYGHGGARAAVAAPAAGGGGTAAAASGCAFPTKVGGSPAETAWQLFVAANCTMKGNQLVWEGWIEQSTLYPAQAGAAQAKAKRLHGSPLARATTVKRLGASAAQLSPSSECNEMNAPPPNVTKKVVCEEARLNPEAQKYVRGNGFQVRPGQTRAAQAGSTIAFPTPAIEVKVDWIPGTDFTPPFTCQNPPKGVHVENIDGTCYAMAGMHIASKLAPNWIWATFEPQNLQTNINRCVTFGACNDPWGSVPAVSSGGKGGFTELSRGLKQLMDSAHLQSELYNYRLDGVQTAFTTASGPTLLGNSIIEGENVGMTAGTASCITCHSVSSIQSTGADGINVLAAMPTPPVGAAYVVPKGSIGRDFVWSLGLACPDGPGQIGSLQTCTATAPAPAAKKP